MMYNFTITETIYEDGYKPIKGYQVVQFSKEELVDYIMSYEDLGAPFEVFTGVGGVTISTMLDYTEFMVSPDDEESEHVLAEVAYALNLEEY